MVESTTLDTALDAMLKAGEKPSREILDRVKAFGAAAIPRLIEIATSKELNFAPTEDPRVYAPLHAIKILGELRATQAVEPLLPMIAWDDDDWLDNYLPEFFGQVGEPAITPLEKILADDSRTIYTQARASLSLKSIAKHHPALRERVVNILTQYLEPAHTDSQDHETRAAFFICDLCDLQATEALPAIRRAYEEDRVDTQVIGLDDVEREMQGLPLVLPEPSDLEGAYEKRHRDGFKLTLRCTQCGREREHNVGTLFVDLGTMDRHRRGEKTKYDEFIITRRIVCPKCGAVDKYEFGGMGHIALTADLLMHLAQKKPLPEKSGPVRYMHFALADGREMHPREGLEVMRREVAREPKRADLRVRLGNVLRFLGYLDEAIAEYKTALERDPKNFEAYLNLGRIYGVQGDFAASREMFERSLRLASSSSQFSAEQRLAAVADIQGDLEQVKRGAKLDPRILTDLAPVTPRGSDRGKESGPVVSITPPAARRAVPGRVGRNDPCPCGSGKKYKHCHGRR